MNEQDTIDLTRADIQYIVDKTVNDVFAALAHKGIAVETDGVVTARITLYLGDTVLLFHQQLLSRVSVRTEPYKFPADTEEIEYAVQSMGFKKVKNAR